MSWLIKERKKYLSEIIQFRHFFSLIPSLGTLVVCHGYEYPPEDPILLRVYNWFEFRISLQLDCITYKVQRAQSTLLLIYCWSEACLIPNNIDSLQKVMNFHYPSIIDYISNYSSSTRIALALINLRKLIYYTKKKPKVFVWNANSLIQVWTQVAESTSWDDNRYITSVFSCLYTLYVNSIWNLLNKIWHIDSFSFWYIVILILNIDLLWKSSRSFLFCHLPMALIGLTLAHIIHCSCTKT